MKIFNSYNQYHRARTFTNFVDKLETAVLILSLPITLFICYVFVSVLINL
jgi:hypothetical protein